MDTETLPVFELSPTWYDACAEYEVNTASPQIRYYGTLVDDAQATGGEDGFITNSDEATDLVRMLVRPLGLAETVKVVPGEFLGDYFVLVPVPCVLPNSLRDGYVWMEFETA